MAKTVTRNRQTLNVCVSAVGTSWIKVYESSDVDCDFTTLMISNKTGSSVDITLSITESASAGDGSGGTLKAYLCYGLPIEANDVLSFSDEVVHLDRGQQLWIKSDTASSLSVYSRIIRNVKVVS